MREGIDYRGPAMSHKWIVDEFYRTGRTITLHEETPTKVRATINLTTSKYLIIGNDGTHRLTICRQPSMKNQSTNLNFLSDFSGKDHFMYIIDL